MFEIIVNGKKEKIKKGLNALQFLDIKNIDKSSIVFVLNEKIIKKDDLESFFICEGDKIEILRFVAGG